MEQQTPTEMSVEDALRLAIHMHRTGEFDDAELLYKKILDTEPEHPDVLQFLGVLWHQRGHSDAAIAFIEKSIALDPGHAGRYNNLGNVLLETVPVRCFAPSHWSLRLIALLVLAGVYFLVTDELDFAENKPVQLLLAGVGLVSVLAFAKRSASALKAS